MNNKFLFRIRLENKIVGYKKYMSAKLYFFSKDLYGFSAKEINYDEQDQATGYMNKNGMQIFENDILIDPKGIIYAVSANSVDVNLTFFRIQNDTITQIPMQTFSELAKTLKQYSYLFINEALKNRLNAIELDYDI